MTRANVVAPAAAWSAPTETTKLLDPDVKLQKEQSQPGRYASFVALFALIWSWVLQAEASQSLQVFFNKPFFLACFNHAASVVLLPLVFAYYKRYGSPEDRYAGYDIVGVLNRHSVIPLPKLARISAALSFLYLVSDFFWYGALGDVSVAAGVAISNASPLFVYCLSVCLLNEHLNFNKIFGVFTAFAGVTLVVMFQDGSDFGAIQTTTIIAGISMIISSALYAGYQVAMRLAIGDDITDTSTLLTMAGLCGLFTFPPWILGTFILLESPFSWLHESLAFPGTVEGVFLLAISGLLTVVFCAFLPLAICWTSPLETSVGCMLTIPLSGLMDTFMHHTVFSWECIVGSVLVMGGFAILECNTKKKSTSPQQGDIPNASAWA
ncbi:Solute carrier family 35 member F5 [Phytophthora cinnamomi]|uniref:Solute carrier family 35 member F5 n=1 Tax=Phytophthora cinnamomi TaxID=4785 RepID=UPI003559DF92|nr:Solute carrier family 35 member F5 [Phytophthora cinnamomi]